MRAFLPGLGDDLRGLGRRIDTVRHHGVPNGCILEVDLGDLPPETAGFDPLAMIAGGGRPLMLRYAVAAIHRAAEDPRIVGLIARVQLSAAPAGPVQELRAAISAFTATKPTVAWAETYPGTLSYYLATAFGEVWMQPSGTVGLIGFATNALFLHDALDKVGIEAQFLARGQYKSAVNTLTESGYTDAHREADSRLIESLHDQVWRGIADSRHIDIAVLDSLANRAPLLRDDAVASGLIDRVGFRDEAYRRIAELAGAPDSSADPDSDDAPPRLFLSRYAQTREHGPSIPGRTKEPVLAVVTVAGPIVSGRGGPGLSPFGRGSAGGDTIAAALREAGADDDVKAVVLRVNSPGGSVNASETIWREVGRIRAAGKPVVASMGAVAASGGYYIAMAADVIIANPATITGSIGVLTGKLVAQELKHRLGVGSGVVRTNDNADAWSVNVPFTEAQHGLVKVEMDLFYDDFVSRVAQARGMSVEAVDAVARGRVWTGADAVECGLVDELGGLRDAVRRAKVLAGLDADATVTLIGYPGSSVKDFLRPRSSSQPAAASMSDAATRLVGAMVQGTIANAERDLTGARAILLGDWRF